MTRVLIVDDNEENLCYLTALLTGHGFTVETARHGAEALVKARREPPEVVISDLLMPVMDGYTLLRHWKSDSRLHAIPFIVHTATYTEDQDERLAMDLGADSFILKATEPEVFMVRLRQVLEKMKSVSSNLPRVPNSDQETLHKSYSETLIRKLEEKTLQLEESNRSLNRDVAERKFIEACLRESEERFRQLAEHINEVFWLTDPDHEQILYVSPAYEKVWGRSCESLHESTATWSEAIHPDDRQRIAEVVGTKKVASGYDEIYRILRPDGSVRWIRDRAFPVADEQGDTYRIAGIAEDITEQRVAAERIREQAALLDQTRDAVLVVDLENKILYWNKAAERVYGWTAAEVIGRTARDLLYRDPVPLDAAVESLLESGHWSGELHNLTKKGKVMIIESRWTLLRNDQDAPKSILAVNTDVTERREMEAQLRRAQRMESVGTLASGIAHDFNNLLVPIVMGVDLIQRMDPGEKVAPILKAMEESARRGTDFVRQVLSFARGVEGQRVSLKIDAIVGEVQSIVANTFPKNVTFQRSIETELWPIVGNATEINQILLNLCVNARDAMADRGCLKVSARNVKVDEQFAAMSSGARAGNYVALEVTDEGCGMSRDIVERVFDPFFTTKAAGKGTGLGLSTARGIVQSHGGFVSVYSELGKGSAFTVYLPAEIGLPAPTVSALKMETLPRGNGELILIVDDETSILNITRQTLEVFGYKVMVATDGAQAIGRYAPRQAEVSLVLTDMAMPIMDGPALIAALNRINPDVRIIAASGLNTEAKSSLRIQTGVKHFLAKPFSVETLLTLVATALSDPDGRGKKV